MVAPHLYRDLAYVFATALAGGLLARRLRLPLILGYVLAGIVVGPFTPGPRLTDTHTLELLAEIGVILLMFSIGIEFSPRELLRVRWVALIGGPLGILLTLALTFAVGRLLGWPLRQSLAIGAAICVASTMVMSRLLMDNGALQSTRGHVMIGITLFEDFAVMMMTVLLPSLAGPFTSRQVAALIAELAKALLILVPLVFLATKWVPRLMARVVRMRDVELNALVILALGLTTAALTQALGLSLALGAFLGGMIISDTPMTGETLKQLQPLRDAFVALFFVTVGALIDPRMLIASPGLLAVLVCLILIGKLVIWTGVVSLFGYDRRTAILAGVGFTQIGEFSYVLIRVARQHEMVTTELYNAVLAASLLTILINAALMRFVPRLLKTGEP